MNIYDFYTTGHKRRLGLIGAKRTTITVHRSEEVLPSDVGRHLVRQGTSVSSEGDAENELLVAQEGERWESIPELKGVDSLRGVGSTNIAGKAKLSN